MTFASAHTRQRRLGVLILSALALAVVACLSLGTAAYAADNEQVVDATSIKVADYTTTLKVSKVDAEDNGAVRGAHLAIYRDNELMIDWWTTDDDSSQKAFDRFFDQAQSKKLDQDVTYTLKELEAPDGYQKAADTTFTLRSVGTDPNAKTFTTTLEASGADAEADGDVIRLKEKRAENWETAYRDKYRNGNQTENGTDKSGSGKLSQTGDTMTLVPVIVLGIAGLSFVALALHRCRHPKAEQ